MAVPQQQAGQQAQQEKMQKQEEARQQMLDAFLSPEAKERLNRIRIVKPEKVRQVEDYIIRMAQSRQLGGPLPDEQLCQLLEKVSESEKGGEVKIAHRGKKDDDAWDDDEDGW
jgi:programmed cell death protein 5